MTDFNVLTINGTVFPSTAPLMCKTGDRVRLRLGNLGAMDHHPMHIHGYHFRVTATDGEDIPLSAQWPQGDGAGRGRADTHGGVHCRRPRRLGISLPRAPSRHESDEA